MNEQEKLEIFAKIFADYVNVQEKEVREAVEDSGIKLILEQPEEVFDGLTEQHRARIKELRLVFSGEFLVMEEGTEDITEEQEEPAEKERETTDEEKE